jgi:hypothetical protein
MQKTMKQFLTGCVLAATLTLGGSAFGFQAAKATKATIATKSPKPGAAAPTDAEIAAAKAKGMVWVNTGTKVYHKDGEFYGKTKQGKFMMAADADKAGFRPAKEPAAAKAKSTSTKKSTAKM